MAEAYFINRPRVLSELFDGWIKKKFAVVKEVELENYIDYKNFCTDMLVERAYLEKYAALCTEDKELKCLMIFCKGRKDGVLVFPSDAGRVIWASYLPERP